MYTGGKRVIYLLFFCLSVFYYRAGLSHDPKRKKEKLFFYLMQASPSSLNHSLELLSEE